MLSVRDLDTSVRFYEDVLGLHVTNVWPGRVTFMSSGEDSSHELALISLGPDAPGPEQRRVGLNHFAWEMETFEELQELYLDLKAKGHEDLHGGRSRDIARRLFFRSRWKHDRSVQRTAQRPSGPSRANSSEARSPTPWRSRRPLLHSRARRRSHRGSMRLSWAERPPQTQNAAVSGEVSFGDGTLRRGGRLRGSCGEAAGMSTSYVNCTTTTRAPAPSSRPGSCPRQPGSRGP